jgi:6-phosphofructokinase 1
MLDFIISKDIKILLCVGGDGTQRAANLLAQEAIRRGLQLAVIGIPKTVRRAIAFGLLSHCAYRA